MLLLFGISGNLGRIGAGGDEEGGGGGELIFETEYL